MSEFIEFNHATLEKPFDSKEATRDWLNTRIDQANRIIISEQDRRLVLLKEVSLCEETIRNNEAVKAEFERLLGEV
jgi:hypothetical protein